MLDTNILFKLLITSSVIKSDQERTSCRIYKIKLSSKNNFFFKFHNIVDILHCTFIENIYIDKHFDLMFLYA